MNIYLINEFSVFSETVISALPKHRREYNNRLKTEKDKKNNAAAYFILKYALFKEKGIILKKNEEFFFGKKGKPYLLNFDIDFSLSHSSAGVICVVHNGRNSVGTDIEAIREYNEKITERVCCEEELKLISNASENEKRELFFEMWVKKEAYSKMTGNGFSEGFDKINTLISKQGAANLLSLKENNYFIGLAVKDEICDVKIVQISSDDILNCVNI